MSLTHQWVPNGPIRGFITRFWAPEASFGFWDFSPIHPSNKPVYYGESELGLGFRKWVWPSNGSQMVPLEDTSRDFGPQKPTLDFCDSPQAHPSNKPVYYGRSELGLEFRKWVWPTNGSQMVPLEDSSRDFGPQKPPLDFGILALFTPVISQFIMGRVSWD